jgi:drug/metabolite transporter (DMT)-like permease
MLEFSRTPAASARAATKAADLTYSTNRNGERVQFDHPFFQSACMFVGEAMCLLTFYLLSWRARSAGKAVEGGKSGFNSLWLALPATCDLLATSTMYVGLGLTDASIFQMLRGSVIVFTGIASVVFLKRKLRAQHWTGMALVVAGVGVVGAQSYICGGGGGSGGSGGNAMLGNILIIVAQVIVAAQMVVEEKLLGAYDLPPLKVVGFEGLFGFTFISILLVVMCVWRGVGGCVLRAAGSGGIAPPRRRRLTAPPLRLTSQVLRARAVLPVHLRRLRPLRGRRGRLRADGQLARADAVAARQCVQHCVLQLLRRLRHARHVRLHAHGAGQRAHHPDLGRVADRQVGGLLLGPAAGLRGAHRRPA